MCLLYREDYLLITIPRVTMYPGKLRRTNHRWLEPKEVKILCKHTQSYSKKDSAIERACYMESWGDPFILRDFRFFGGAQNWVTPRKFKNIFTPLGVMGWPFYFSRLQIFSGAQNWVPPRKCQNIFAPLGVGVTQIGRMTIIRRYILP